jgi:hypothetical protein
VATREVRAVERTWTEVGAEYVERLGKRSVEHEIEALEWTLKPEGGTATVGMMPGMAINKLIEEFALPRVTGFAISGFERPGVPDVSEGFYPGFYGIEVNYSNGRARIYVLDVGATLIPLASDFWATEEVAA